MKAAVVAVGDELLLGDITNRNAAWLGAELAAVGAPVVHSSMVGDDAALIATAVRRAMEDADVVVLTGGLGPTSDDLTRDALALVAGVALVRDAALEAGLAEKFAAFGLPMPAAVLRQADVPAGATALDNPVGTAPGLRLETGGRLLFAMPGPPHELAACARGGVLPELAARSGQVVLTRTLHCAGAGESTVAELVEATIGAREQLPPGVELAYLAGGAVVRVRLTTAARDEAAADAVLQPYVQRLGVALGDLVFGRDHDTLPSVVVRLLQQRGATVAVAESLTAGLVTAALTDVPGSSAVVRGGLVVYATDLKQTLGGVPEQVLAQHGAVSAETATALAREVRVRLGADYGLALTGVAGPDEQEGHPAGTVHVAVADAEGEQHRQLRLPGDRDRVRALAVTSALDLLRRRAVSER